GVTLVDKTHARLFSVFLGEIEEHCEVFAPAEVTHTKTTGTDWIWSQKRFQRKADMQVRWHLKHVAEMLDHMADHYKFDRLVRAGSAEATSELYHLFSKRLRARVVEKLALPIETGEHTILAETLRIERQMERHVEQRLVEELIAADKLNHITLGLENTVHALN